MNNANDISTQLTNHIHQTWMVGGGVSYSSIYQKTKAIAGGGGKGNGL